MQYDFIQMCIDRNFANRHIIIVRLDQTTATANTTIIIIILIGNLSLYDIQIVLNRLINGIQWYG